MRRLLVLALLLCALPVGAQVNYYPATGGGSGDLLDPGSDGLLARTAEGVTAARSITSSAGTIVIGNADGVAGNVTLDVDTSIYGQFSTGSGSFGGTCTPGDWYYETDTFFATLCPVTDTGYTLVTLPHASGTPTDDNTLVGSGTAWEKKALPDCDDTAGNHLNYDTTTNAWSCGTSGDGTGAAFDPGTGIVLYEDFLGGNTTSGGIGNTGVSTSVISTGTVDATIVGTAANPGILRLKSHATNDDSGASLSWAAAGGGIALPWSAGNWTYDAIVIPGSNSTAITNVQLIVGFLASPSSITPAAGMYVRFDTDRSDSTFMFQLCAASGAGGCPEAGDNTNSAVAASTITPSGGTAYRFRIRKTGTTYGFRVNDETEVTFCASGCTETTSLNPASVANYPTVQYLTRTTTGVLSADVDYVNLSVFGMTRY